ncbi:hypothetical protein ACFY2W_22825 [Streptomyces sp. NPDC001262]|uniref:hypothetical protein n=1 Tax=unclassified Streptomyces TaxID=2593676 RepID=UPI00369E355E
MKPTHQRLLDVAASQGGVLLTSQAAECGVPAAGAPATLRRAGWTRLYVGTWAAPGKQVDLRLRLLAVQLGHPHLVASHGAAAVLHGIEMVRSCTAEFTDPLCGRASRKPGITVHPVPLAAHEIRHVKEVRVTTVLRTICDLMLTLPLHEAVIAADSELARGRVRREHIADALAPPNCRRTGVRAARRALALTDPASGSPAESKARLEMREAGLFPESQARVVTRNGRVRRLDFLFRAEGLGVEIEGFAWHGSRSAHQNDAIRFNELLGCPGVREILRFTRDDVFRRPRRFIRTVQEALQRLRGAGPMPMVGADRHPKRGDHG